jgi:hypothetical protein
MPTTPRRNAPNAPESPPNQKAINKAAKYATNEPLPRELEQQEVILEPGEPIGCQQIQAPLNVSAWLDELPDNPIELEDPINEAQHEPVQQDELQQQLINANVVAVEGQNPDNSPQVALIPNQTIGQWIPDNFLGALGWQEVSSTESNPVLGALGGCESSNSAY